MNTLLVFMWFSCQYSSTNSYRNKHDLILSDDRTPTFAEFRIVTNFCFIDCFKFLQIVIAFKNVQTNHACFLPISYTYIITYYKQSIYGHWHFNYLITSHFLNYPIFIFICLKLITQYIHKTKHQIFCVICTYFEFQH